MVDVNTQNKTISVNVSSSGMSSNVSVSGDTSYYYSEKAREWAISNRIVDGVDYSSKYYANKSNQSALNAQTSEINARNTYTDLQATANQKLEDLSNNTNIALENIGIAEDSALNNIDIAKDSILTEINTAKNNVITEINNTGINTKADITLNNLTDEGKAKFDSPWVSCNEYQIFSNVGLSSSTYSEYTLDFLPDNSQYELSCTYMTNSGTNNGYGRLALNDESESYRVIVGANTRTAQNTFAYGQVNLIVSNKKVKAMRIAGGNGNEKFSLTAVAYRKVGTGF